MQKVISFFRLSIGLAYMAIVGGAFFAVCVVLLPSRRLRIAATNVFGHWAGRFCLWITDTTVKGNVRGEMAKTRPAIYVSNHTSITDIWIAIMGSPMFTCGMAKKEIVYYPFFGQLYWISGHLRVDRDNRAQAVRSLRETAAVAKEHGLSLFIWAEGTRSRDGKLLPFKKGFGHLAMATRLPIVPVVVKGAHKGWTKNEMLFRHSEVEVEVLPAIPTDDWTSANLDQKLAAVHATFNAALPEDQRGPAMTYVPRKRRTVGLESTPPAEQVAEIVPAIATA
ncbi:MAG: 1-acyl-sn-glycerol-3-phosphate acyltransferase [Deltaproteobacteria bacterium]|nr:1-acyl-sn-glycerol-3-phosphate acyltransferase [Deltaproteobacteria bacterium]